jgi:hypothetical protein
LDRVKNYSEMLREEKIQKNAAAIIPFQIYLKRRDSERAQHQKNTNVR